MVVALSSGLSIIQKEIKDGDPKSALKSISETRRTLKRAVNNLKNMAAALRPLNLDVIGLTGALRDHISSITRNRKLKVEFRVDIDENKLSDDVAIALYRVVQESLNNTLRHARAKRVEIDVSSRGNVIDLNIRDDGRGFDLEEVWNRHVAERSLGLAALDERSRMLGGVLDISTRKGDGTRITLSVPKRKEKGI